MKKFREIRSQSRFCLQESRLLRKGTAAVFAAQSKRHGNAATSKFKGAIRSLSQVTNSSSDSEKIDQLGSAQKQLLDGLIDLRHQLGSITSIATTGTLLSERTSAQIRKITRKR